MKDLHEDHLRALVGDGIRIAPGDQNLTLGDEFGLSVDIHVSAHNGRFNAIEINVSDCRDLHGRGAVHQPVYHAPFALLDKDGKEIDRFTTDSNGRKRLHNSVGNLEGPVTLVFRGPNVSRDHTITPHSEVTGNGNGVHLSNGHKKSVS